MNSTKVKRDIGVEEAINRAVANTLRDPLWGAKNILRLELDPWQKELIEAVWDVKRFQAGKPTKYNHKGHNKIAVRAMHGPGKTFGVAALLHLWLFCHRTRSPGLATAPKEAQLADRLWPALSKVRNMAIAEYQTLCQVDATRMTFIGDRNWGVTAETASHPDNLAGFHDDYLPVICEEANGIDEKFFPVIEGAISTGITPILILIGNPTTTSGTFYDAFNSVKVAKNYYQLHVSLDKTTRVSRAWVQEMMDKYGADSPIVKVRCLGEFADFDEMQLIAMQWIERAKTDTLEGDGSHPTKRISIDVADGGVDETVLTYAKHYATKVQFLRQESFNFSAAQSPVMAAEAAIRMWEAYELNAADGDTLVVDSMGVGSGTAGILIKAGYPVITYRGGESSDDAKKWRCRRVQSYMVMRDFFRDGRIEIAKDFTSRSDDLMNQLCSIRGRPGVEKIEDLETKIDAKKRGIKSPDMADSMVMQFATMLPQYDYNTPDTLILGGETSPFLTEAFT
jgi:phage terminase large subunit